MKVYHLKRTQFLPITLGKAWQFFSSPQNLREITPPHMKFKILYVSGDQKMYPGQLIRYYVHVLPGIRVHWVTEITHVAEPYRFVDEQRFGPYALWHHTHFFREVDGGIEMTDEVNYAIPMGILGRFANWLFVEKQVNAIFDYRFNILEQRFRKTNENLLV
ncbi:MAG: SRPBCC family protein [Cyclobacteriaceae bacterium]